MTTLLAAGIPVADALRRLAEGHEAPLSSQLQDAAQYCAAGQTLARALLVAGLCAPRWRDRLDWAERCGCLLTALGDISDELEDRQARWSRVKARMMPGGGLLVMAVLAALAMSVARGCGWLDVIGLITAFLWVFAVGLGLRHGVMLDGIDVARWCRRLSLDRVSPMAGIHMSRLWVALVSQGLRAGLTPVTVTDALAAVYPDEQWQRDIRFLRARLSRGESVANAFVATGWALPEGLRAALVSGEAAGRMDQALSHWLLLTGQRVDLCLQELDAIMPWAFYTAVLLVVPTVMNVAFTPG